jgi:hypothetical protein
LKKETLKEIGKGFIAFANLIGGLSLINGLFGVNSNLPNTLIAGIVIYSVIILYITGIKFINEGTD